MKAKTKVVTIFGLQRLFENLVKVVYDSVRFVLFWYNLYDFGDLRVGCARVSCDLESLDFQIVGAKD